MYIREYQHEVGEWVNYNFGAGTPISAVVGLSEEVGELCRAILKQHQKVRGTYDEWQDEIMKELGDVFIKLCDVANEANINLEFAIKDRWTEIKKRDWRADPVGHGIPATTKYVPKTVRLPADYAESAE